LHGVLFNPFYNIDKKMKNKKIRCGFLEKVVMILYLLTCPLMLCENIKIKNGRVQIIHRAKNNI